MIAQSNSCFDANRGISRRQLFMASFAALAICTLTGCVQEKTDGSTHTFTYELWLPLVVLLVGMVVAPIGWMLRIRSSRYGWSFLILGPVAAIGFAPSLFLERSVVDETGLSIRSGIWGLTAVHELKYAKLRTVSLTSEEVRGRRGSKRTKYYLNCNMSDGTTKKVQLGNNVSQSAAPYFLKEANERGIPVFNET